MEPRHRGVTGISTLSRADLETRLKASRPEWTEESSPFGPPTMWPPLQRMCGASSRLTECMQRGRRRCADR